MDRTQLATWLERYGQAWQQRDPQAAAQLFAADAEYFETPYAEPFRGAEGVREYWARVTADQRDVNFNCQPLGVVDGAGVATWSASFTAASSGTLIEMNGVFLLEFDETGLCRRLREWWHVR